MTTRTYAALRSRLLVAFMLTLILGACVVHRHNRKPDLSAALIEAIEHYDTARVATLLQAGADPNTRRDSPKPMEDCPVLMIAVNAAYYSGDRQAPVVRMLLSRGARVEEADKYGRTALLQAAEHDRTDLVALLLQAGANPNTARGHYGPWTALMAAVEHGNADMVALLLKYGADPNIHPRGKTSKSLLAQEEEVAERHARVVRLLRQAGAKEHPDTTAHSEAAVRP